MLLLLSWLMIERGGRGEEFDEGEYISCSYASVISCCEASLKKEEDEMGVRYESRDCHKTHRLTPKIS
jgi:hypothetical protein